MIRTSIMAFEINPPSPNDDTLSRPSVLPQIFDLLKDPEAPIEEVLRLITIEIAHIAAAMRTCTERRAPLSQMKSNMNQIRALQLLSGTVVKTHPQSRSDELNMDGPKFEFVSSQILACFTDALTNVTKKPKEDFFNQTILKEFRDLLAVREPEIRRKLPKII
jgi:hypothetical protein